MTALHCRQSLIIAGLLAACIAAAPRVGRGATGAAGERRLTIIYTAEVHGAVEPCGCTSDPLGDISRFAEVVRTAKREAEGETPAGAVLLVDAGSLLYAEGGSAARERLADDARAEFLASELTALGLAGAGLGETDLAAGPAHVRPKRLASNFSPSAIVIAPAVHLVGKGARAVKVGILGIADPSLADQLDAKSEDIGRAVRRDADRLRKEGAELIVVLAPVDKSLARRVTRNAAVDLVILGRQVGPGQARAERVVRAGAADAAQKGADAADGDGATAFLLSPADELQRVGRVDIVLRAGARPGLRDAGGSEAIKLRQDEVERALGRLDAELARWNRTGSGSGAAGNDASFVAAKKQEREALMAERATLAAPWVAPRDGNFFVNRLIALRRTLPRDPVVVAAMKRLDGRVAAINLKSAQPPPRPEPGRASFVGVAACGECHARAVQFWKQTVHAGAWKTLVVAGKQADYKCVGCHLTGYGQVGGSSLGFTKGLESVQCENCHGPASIHAAAKTPEGQTSVRRAVPETTCLACHNEHHSDTFQYQAYLRDILGDGHGAEARKKLGAGPTGHGLRAAAVAKSKVAATGVEPAKKM